MRSSSMNRRMRQSPEENQINDNERDNDRDETETEHVANVMSGDALACPRSGNGSSLRRRLSIGLFIFRRSGIWAHFGAHNFISVLVNRQRAV